MSLKLTALAAGLGLMSLAGTVAAAPLGGVMTALSAEAKTAAGLEQVHYRGCWRYGPYGYCVRPAPRVYSFYVRPRHNFYWNYGYRRWY